MDDPKHPAGRDIATPRREQGVGFVKGQIVVRVEAVLPT